MSVIFEVPKGNNLEKDLTENLLTSVCERMFGTGKFEKSFVNRTIGRFAVLKNTEDNSRNFVCFSSLNNDSRNAFLMQFISPAYIAYSKDKGKRKTFNIYIIDTKNKNANTPYMELFYRCFLTLGFNILNLNELPAKIYPFSNFDELQKYRETISKKNNHNHSTYFEDCGDKILIYGKTFGANAMESFILTLTISSLTKKELVFYPVLDNESKKLSNEQYEIFEKAGVKVSKEIYEFENDIDLSQNEKDLRDSPKFHYNLLKKFGRKYCYLCGCDIGHLIIGAHIHRVSDIKISTLSKDEKVKQIVDCDNGLWLCASHDKLFEYGLILFEKRKLILKPNLTETEKSFIKTLTFEMRNLYFSKDDNCVKLDERGNVDFYISEEHFNKNMNLYLLKHKERFLK